MSAVDALRHGPFLWFLNRSTGVTLMVLFTLTTALGLLSARSRRGWLPAMVTHALHRNLALLSLVLLAVHVGAAVIDTYVDIRWWQAFWPVGAQYRPFWLGLGTLALDVALVLVLTSLARGWLSPRAWRAVHWAGYAAWPVAMAHGAGIGTDASTRWGRITWWCCVAVVAVALLARRFDHGRSTRRTSSTEVGALQ